MRTWFFIAIFEQNQTMNIEDLREYCLSKNGVSESFPFDETTLVFKVMNKMFALTDTEDDFSINIKCDSEKVFELRERYPAVKPGYHMSKKHWNTVVIDGSVEDGTLYKWIDDSYNLVVSKLTKSLRESLSKM